MLSQDTSNTPATGVVGVGAPATATTTITPTTTSVSAAPPSSSSSSSSSSVSAALAPQPFTPSPNATASSSATPLRTANANKTHVLRACVNCRKAHLACDADRPCKRCVSLSKEQTCYDVDHKKRGRPKLRQHGQRVQRNAMTTPMRQSSFSMTTDTSATTLLTQTYTSPIITAFLSMEICCARVSDEVQQLLGYYPQELAHRPLFSFIAPRSSETLARLHRVLLDNVTHVAQRADPAYQRMPPTERTTSDKFFSQHPDTLTAIANGSQTVSDTLWVKRNDGAVEPLTTQFYLGGGLGADLYTPSTLTNLYIVCLLSRPAQTQQQARSQQQQHTEQPVSDGSGGGDGDEQQQQQQPPTSSSTLQPSPQQQHPLQTATASSFSSSSLLHHQHHHHHHKHSQQRPVAPRQSQPSSSSMPSDNRSDQPVLLTHPSNPSIPLRAPWQQVHVAPVTNDKDPKSNSTIDYVKQSMRLFQSTEPSRSSNMSVDALLS
ncbi:hypothetical protein BDB00DRAFT_821654 [Zychaea mexicana]|uniref:uncharacterized protein n=1 Tax=Zychaea mexicana TaxID=64656 RepID=UPI0022FF048C|nr:uncharacterized protein BDB00DRAFT_821654 [Zychaea mexicana]KAI9493802.1 hypothetical protein BDB00DRAFT_821654 [Zychaea mexicana]